jgi:hypothetical protein
LRAEGFAQRRRYGDLPPVGLTATLPLAVLPGGPLRRSEDRTRLRAVWEGLAVVVLAGAAYASCWIAAGLAPLPDRYLAPFLVLLAAFVPVALGRAGGILAATLRTRAAALLLPLAALLVPPLAALLLPPLAAVGALAAVHGSWIDLAGRPAGARSIPSDPGMVTAMAWAAARMGPDDLLYDCSSMELGVTLAPARPRRGACPPDLLRSPGGLPPAVHPQGGRAWLVARLGDPSQSGTALAALVAAGGWVPDPVSDGPPGLSFWRAPD